MQNNYSRLPTLESIAQNTVILKRIGADSWSPQTLAWFDSFEEWIKSAFGTINLSDLNPFDLNDSPLSKVGDWGTGRIRFCFVNEDEEDNSKWSLIYPNKQVALVVGLMHCPSMDNLGKAFEAFQEQTFKQYPFLDDSAMRCCAFDIEDDQQQRFNIPELMKRGLEVFPPSSGGVIQDANETTVQFHMRFILNTATSKFIRRQEELIRECDAMSDTMKKISLRRTTSGLTLPTLPSPVTSNPTPSIPPIKDAETCRLFSGSPSYPGDASHPFVTTTANNASRKSLRTLQARLQVWIGKHCLLAGSPLDALERLIPATALCRSAEDTVWEAVCNEAIACTRLIIQKDGWAANESPTHSANSPSVILSPTQQIVSLPNPMSPSQSPGPSQVVDNLDASIVLLQKCTSNYAVRMLLAETCIRVAHARLEKASPENDKVTDPLSAARRAHAEQNTLAWYMTLEARLWSVHKQQRLMLLCMAEAFLRFINQQEHERAYRVVEEDFASCLEGFVPFSVLRRRQSRRAFSSEEINLNQQYNYSIALLLRTLIRTAEQRPEDRDRFTFYGFQFLGLIASKAHKTAKDREAILRLVSQMSSSKPDVVTIESKEAATFPIVESISPLSVSPKLWFDITGKEMNRANNYGNSNGTNEQKSAFIFSPFRENSLPSIKTLDGEQSNSEQAQEVFWVAGEEAFLSIRLTNPFDVPVSCSLLVEKNEPKKLVVPGRESLDIKMGPFVDFDPDAEVLRVELHALGAKFVMRTPMPTVVHAMPLLIRDEGGNVFRNIGQGKAHVFDDQGKIVLEIDPGIKVKSTTLSAVRYCNREQRPRLVRELAPSVPLVKNMKIQRCDTMDHLKFGTTASASLNLDILDENLRGKNLCVFLDSPENTLLSSTVVHDDHLDVKFVIPRLDKEITEHTQEDKLYDGVFETIRLELDGHAGSIVKKAKSPSVSSTAPPAWCFLTQLKIEQTFVKVLEFSTVSTEWSIPRDVVGYIHFDLVVFRKNKDTYEPCDDDVVWAGSSSWACQAGDGMNSAKTSFTLLRANEYIVAWSAMSKLRVRWWLKCVKVTAA